MGEYQYYEFKAIRRELTQAEQDTVRSLSTRATLTPTSFKNEYRWGSFRGDPVALLRSCYDTYVHWNSWGARTFGARVPASAFAAGDVEPFRCESLEVHEGEGCWVLLFRQLSTDMQGDVDWHTDWLRDLEGTWRALVRGDLRPLYLAWLSAVATGYIDEGALQAPVPANLGALSPQLEIFVDFMRVHPDLLHVASAASTQTAHRDPNERLPAWVASLDSAEKDAALTNILLGRGDTLVEELLARFRQTPDYADALTAALAMTATGGTVRELLQAAGLEDV